jgi:hypothetical protein
VQRSAARDDVCECANARTASLMLFADNSSTSRACRMA